MTAETGVFLPVEMVDGEVEFGGRNVEEHSRRLEFSNWKVLGADGFGLGPLSD